MLFGAGFFSERAVAIGPHNTYLHILYRVGFLGVFLSLDGGIFTLSDKTSPSYAVCTQADDRLPRKFDAKIGWVITVNSGAEVNMSEELFQHLVKYYKRNNEYLRRY